MAVRIVRLGAPRFPAEGIRLGTVRRPPRGIPKQEYASQDFYDAWLPELGPSDALLAWARSRPMTDARWAQFVARYRREMRAPPAQRLLTLIALLSRTANLSVGCYCEDEARCHRSVLRALLADAGAVLAAGAATARAPSP
jgi:uncharacterized protein YeaO (DUF488 family)